MACAGRATHLICYCIYSPACQPPIMSANASHRLPALDALRGLVICLMLLDHVRETFFLHAQVPDPMVVADTSPGLFFSRLLAHLCAPVFIFLAGVSAWLYGHAHADARRTASRFLLTRGLFLVVLEITLVNFAWTFQFPPQVIYLQVIWAIGLAMLALSALLWLPRPALFTLALILIAGHNLLDGLHFPQGHWLHVPWAILHDRSWLELGEGLRLRTSYPVLPWIGVIAAGFSAGPWFAASFPAAARHTRLLATGLGLLLLFALLRGLDGYGDAPRQAASGIAGMWMSVFNVTKYPPSLLFLALTLGIGLLLLWALERLHQRAPQHRLLRVLAGFGAAPMFFYLLHLYLLKLLYLAAETWFGTNQGDYFGFSHIGAVWLTTLLLLPLLYPATRTFARFKARRRDLAWLRYF